MNFMWAMGYNVLMIPFAAGAFFPLLHVSVPPWMAGGAMAMSSVCVVTSSLLLKRYTPPDAGKLAARWHSAAKREGGAAAAAGASPGGGESRSLLGTADRQNPSYSKQKQAAVAVDVRSAAHTN